MNRFLRVVSATAFATAIASAQDDPLCGGCETSGRVPNKLALSSVDAEKDVIYCSEAMKKDKVAFGADEVSCLKCRGTSYHNSAKTEIDAEIESRKTWLADRKKQVDDLVRRECVHIQTRHFHLAFDLPSVKVGQVTYSKHAAAHLYAERLEALYAEIRDLLQLMEGEISGTRRYVYLVEGDRAGAELATQHTNQTGSRSARYGIGSIPHQIVTAYTKASFLNDEDYHQHVCHVVSHHIFHDVDQTQHWLVERYGWVQEGLAHLMEIRLFGPPNTWCHREASGFVHWKGKNWEANVKKAVLAGTQPRFEELQQRPADALTAEEHQFSWSYVDYLMWLDPTAMPKLLGLMKGPQLPVRDCLQQAYGLSVPAFVAGWEEFVKTEYSLTPKKGPQPRAPKGAEPEPEEGDSESEDDDGGR
jgi:hypothetical protein